MLFKLKNKKKDSEFAYIDGGELCNEFISSQDSFLHKVLKSIDFSTKEQSIWHFYSNVEFGLHDIVIFIAKKITNPNVIISSFNISDVAARALLGAKDKRLIGDISLILHKQKASQFKSALSILENKIPYYLAQIHAKIAVVYSTSQKFTIVSSGNLSTNNNIERGFISNASDIFNFDYNFLNGIIKKATKSG